MIVDYPYVISDIPHILDVIPLKDAGGVNEIRAMDGPDWAHNRIKCPA